MRYKFCVHNRSVPFGLRLPTMRSHVLSPYLLILILGTVVQETMTNYLVKIDGGETSVKDVKTKLEKLLGKYVPDEDLTSIADDVTYCPGLYVDFVEKMSIKHECFVHIVHVIRMRVLSCFLSDLPKREILLMNFGSV
ncbi:hypothetical protein AHF37_08894 [Paragonimus kellicotti]|nr:hypothetical protein AHF37_08894 [Paragonimus kellicotti]